MQPGDRVTITELEEALTPQEARALDKLLKHWRRTPRKMIRLFDPHGEIADFLYPHEKAALGTFYRREARIADAAEADQRTAGRRGTIRE